MYHTGVMRNDVTVGIRDVDLRYRLRILCVSKRGSDHDRRGRKVKPTHANDSKHHLSLCLSVSVVNAILLRPHYSTERLQRLHDLRRPLGHLVVT